MSVLPIILCGWAVMAVIMGLLWLVQRRNHNAGIVDIAWSFGTGMLGVGFALAADGPLARRALVAALAGVWGARLGAHLLQRLGREAEDGRYRTLRERWGDRTQLFLFIFFQVQALWAVLFALPMLLAASNPAPALAWFDVLGAAVWLAAMVGEGIADRQLAAFKADPANRGKVCRRGLWKYSRHPNYFFEWIHWWAYVAIGFSGPWGWLTVAGPLLMLLFLLKVTGIPPTEAQALRSRGDAYREYQRTTSVFFPWPPRQESPT